MDKDFHYYVTCAAAMAAGWEKEEAVLMARNSQYVDDCIPGLNREETYVYNDCEYGYLSTSCGMFEHTVMNKTARNAIWVSFHYLPGNFKCKDDKEQGKRHYKDYKGKETGPSWRYNKETFKLLCTPKSCLSERMINECMKYKDKWFYLELIGICLHVLADTVSHAFFSGEAQWSSNEAIDNIYRVDHGVDKVICFDKEFEERSPAGAGYENVNYAGHARAGRIPDYPFCDYKYIPQWNSEKTDNVVHIENRKNYLSAFRLLVQAFYCIKHNMPFEYDKEFIKEYKFKGRDLIPLIQECIEFDYGLFHKYPRSVEMRCRKLRKDLADIGIDLSGSNDYDPCLITDNSKASRSFNYAALKHFLFVRAQLFENDIEVFGEVAGIEKEHEISMRLNRLMRDSKTIDTDNRELFIWDNLAEDTEMLKHVDPEIKKFFNFFGTNGKGLQKEEAVSREWNKEAPDQEEWNKEAPDQEEWDKESSEKDENTANQVTQKSDSTSLLW